MSKPLLIILSLFAFNAVSAQNPDNKKYFPDSTHNPYKAVIQSLIIPGWGQAYNHSLWKVPLIYIGLSSFASYAISNQRSYAEFVALAKIKRLGSVPPPSSSYYRLYIKYKNIYERYSYITEGDWVTLSDAAVRDRDLCILGFVGMWGINVLDAYIEAKFIKSYTMDNRLSFKVSPALINGNVYAVNSTQLIPSIKITFYIN